MRRPLGWRDGERPLLLLQRLRSTTDARVGRPVAAERDSDPQQLNIETRAESGQVGYGKRPADHHSLDMCFRAPVYTIGVEDDPNKTLDARRWLAGHYDDAALHRFIAERDASWYALYLKLRVHKRYKEVDGTGIVIDFDFCDKLATVLESQGLTFRDVPAQSLGKLTEIWRTTDKRVSSSLRSAVKVQKNRIKRLAAVSFAHHAQPLASSRPQR